jgi:hypothetical protein
MEEPAALRAPIRVLVEMRSLGGLRYFKSTVEELVARGHRVTVIVEDPSKHGPIEQAWVDGMSAHPNFGYETRPRYRKDRWHRRALRLRAALEYLHYLRPEYSGRPRYARKALRRSPPELVRCVAALPVLGSGFARAASYRILAAIERALPLPAEPQADLRRLHPDVLVIADFGSRASQRTPFVRTAVAEGIPTVLAIGSWDNLTTRPPMHVTPHVVTVWNEAQREEAVHVHGVPPDRVRVLGAPNFDQWFTWRPRPRAFFLERVGLDPTKPVILWVGSALNQWEVPEPSFFERWLAAVRSSGDRMLEQAGVLVRPHPLRTEHWDGSGFSRNDNVALWPRRDAAMPIDDEQSSDYFDSIYHAAVVVGINTSAMIEASIVGRPILSVVEPTYFDSQHGAIHFAHLLEQGQGALRLAPTMEEHFVDLGRHLHGEDELRTAEVLRSFVERFVRPNGIDRPVTPLVVDTLEEIAELGPEPEPEPWHVRAIRLAITAAFLPFGRRKLVKRMRKLPRRYAAAAYRRLRRIPPALVETPGPEPQD